MLNQNLLLEMSRLTQFYSENRKALSLFFVDRPNARILNSMKEIAKQYAIKVLDIDESSLSKKQECLMAYICNAQIGLITWWLENGTMEDLPILVDVMIQANTMVPLPGLE